MKKISTLMSIILVITLLVMTTPAAAEENAPVGDRIGMYFPPATFTAGAPFNIRHGWVQTANDGAIGVFDFTLDVDGVPAQLSYHWFYSQEGDPDVLYRIFVYNFTQGMPEGTYTFTGHWFAPCQFAVLNLGYSGTCLTPNQKVETYTRSATITFVP